MTYLLDKSRTRKRNTKIVVGIIAFLFVVFFWSTVRNVSYPVVEPVLVVSSNGTSALISWPKDVIGFFKTKIYYENKVDYLEQSIEELKNKISIQEDLINKQNLLNGIAEKREISKLVVANPLIRDITSIYGTIILSKGFSDGVHAGDLVYIKGFLPIGFIETVHDNTSELKLFSSSDNKVDGVLASEKSISLIGIGGGSFIANLPKDFQISIGDEIYYGPRGGGVLGQVSDIKNDIQDTFLKVYIKGEYNPTDVNNFYIEKND